MLHQLRCGGVLEAVRISCAGFPTKTLYEDFVDHFWNLVPELLTADHDLDDKALSEAVLKKANLQGYQCGETKVTIPLFVIWLQSRKDSPKTAQRQSSAMMRMVCFVTLGSPQHETGLLIKLTPKGVVFSFLFYAA